MTNFKLIKLVKLIVKTAVFSLTVPYVSYRDGIPFAKTAQGLAKVSQTFSQLVQKLCLFAIFSQFYGLSRDRSKRSKAKGAALLLFVLFFLVASLVMVISISRGVYEDLARYHAHFGSKQSFYGAEGGIEDAVYRHRSGLEYSNSESFAVGSSTVTMARTTIIDYFEIVAVGTLGDYVRSSEVALVLGNGASFNFGLQSNTGGLTLSNSASVHGNVFSNGTIVGAGNMIYGDAISAGPSGLIDTVHATGSAWAHTIDNADIDRDAYYQTILATVVGGISYPGSADQATSSMPIEDAQIESWKTEAAGGTVIPLASCSGGTSAGTYTIQTDQTIGPMRVPCNFTISKNGTDVSVAGPVWVEGNFSTENGPVIQVDPSAVAGRSSVIVADNPSNRLTSSKISIQGSTGFLGASGSSYIFLASMNNSAANGGGEIAINIDNNTPTNQQEVIYYAPYGLLAGSNNLQLRGATAHRISLSQSAAVYYETGMISILFTGGSGGSFVIESWNEIE